MIPKIMYTALFSGYLAIACAESKIVEENVAPSLKQHQVETSHVPSAPQKSNLESKLIGIQVVRKREDTSFLADVSYTNTGRTPIGPLKGIVSVCYVPPDDLLNSNFCIAGGDAKVSQLTPGVTMKAEHTLNTLGKPTKIPCMKDERVAVLHLNFESIGYDVSHKICP